MNGEDELEQLYAMVKRTAIAMRKRLKQKYLEGRNGWRWDEDIIRWRLGRSIRRKKWVDVCNLAAMLHNIEHNKESKS